MRPLVGFLILVACAEPLSSPGPTTTETRLADDTTPEAPSSTANPATLAPPSSDLPVTADFAATVSTGVTTTPNQSTFAFTVEPVTGADLPTSWRKGCPIGPAELRRLTLVHWGFDGGTHQGVLVVHTDYAESLATVFQELFAMEFPIERIEPADAYGGDDDASMAANNTSAFNCRPVSGTSTWSQHAFGWAVDLNPIQNPFLSSSGRVDPPAGAQYLDRSDLRPGMVSNAVVAAFAAIGWGWGGDWSSPIDYQHFSATGS